jgi:uncharacterized membrane protein
VEELLVTAVGYLKLAVEAVGAAIVGFGALATVVVYLLSLFGIRKRSYTEIRLFLGRYLALGLDQGIMARRRLRRINPLVVLGDNLLVEDAYLFHHQQPHVLDDVACQLLLGDVLAFYVEPEVLPLQATSVGEVHLEIELHSSVRGVFVHLPPLSSEISYDIHSTL